MDTLIGVLNGAEARYLVIGGQAVRLHGLPRFSMDWDIFIPPHDENNFARITRALGDDLDVELLPLGPRGENVIQTYQTKWGVIQFHLSVPGLPSFDDAERSCATRLTEDGEPAKCLSARDLLASKRTTNRPQDQQDILFLEELLRQA
ncbi:MAG TPA: hypothetical protein PKE12_12420 [Kiritimatiellia bacterium]|nr:hypothetical protein [Kiritimatiellia bacterium]